MAPTGYCALVLHAHLPFVRHPEFNDCLEERWLYEAVLESYLPLLDVMEGWRRDGVPARLTLSVSPTLAAMLDDPLLRERCARFLATRLELAEREVERTQWDSAFHQTANEYARQFRAALHAYESVYARDLVKAFASFQASGQIELIGCSATHGFLPLMETQPAAVRAQLSVAADDHAARYGAGPAGIWTGECGYFGGLDTLAREVGLKYTFIDAHGLMHADRKPVYGVFAPAYCPSGLAVFGRDPLASRVVWSADEGYPGHPLYREFYRDIGFDLDWDWVAPYIHESGQRVATGIKYHRVTGPVALDEKLPYDPAAAQAQAERHAADFVEGRAAQLRRLANLMDRPPLILAPFDAELFGHWWHEGPVFLDHMMRKMCAQRNVIEPLTPRDYLQRHSVLQVLRPAYSSWGSGGYAAMWLDPTNDWIYPLLHAAAERMTRLARRESRKAQGKRRRALNQMARELLLAQSSDWAFLIKTNTAAHYATRRTREHLANGDRLAAMIEGGKIDDVELSEMESRTPIFAGLEFEVYS